MQRRIPSLDGLRAISITLVMFDHLVKWKHVSVQALGSYGLLGVHVFFVWLSSPCSGFERSLVEVHRFNPVRLLTLWPLRVEGSAQEWGLIPRPRAFTS
jgi:hypothetical protein